VSGDSQQERWDLRGGRGIEGVRSPRSSCDYSCTSLGRLRLPKGCVAREWMSVSWERRCQKSPRRVRPDWLTRPKFEANARALSSPHYPQCALAHMHSLARHASEWYLNKNSPLTSSVVTLNILSAECTARAALGPWRIRGAIFFTSQTCCVQSFPGTFSKHSTRHLAHAECCCDGT